MTNRECDLVWKKSVIDGMTSKYPQLPPSHCEVSGSASFTAPWCLPPLRCGDGSQQSVARTSETRGQISVSSPKYLFPGVLLQ